MQRLVIVGSGLGGLASAWDAVRRLSDAKVTVVGDERPYVRHKLRLVAAGRDITVSTRHVEAWGAEFVGGEVTRIRRDKREVILEDGRSLEYDYLILATGANSSRPRCPGAERTIGYRRVGDVERLREESPSRVAMVGASLVALHAADTCLALGAEPHVLVRSRLVRKSLEPELSRELEDRLSREGVVFDHGKVREITEGGVRMDDGTLIDADVVVSAMGVTPEVRLAREAGIDLWEDWAVMVDRQGRTSDPRIFAVGDCAVSYDPVTGRPGHFAVGEVATLMAYNAIRAISGSKAALRTPRYIKDVFIGGNFLVSVGFTSVEAEKAGFDVDRRDLSGTEWGDRAFLVYERGTGRILGFSAVSSRDLSWKAAEMEKAVERGRKVGEVLGG